MSNQKVSELTIHTTPAGNDLFYVVDVTSGTALSKRITFDLVFGNVPSNTNIDGTLTVSDNVFFTRRKYTSNLKSQCNRRHKIERNSRPI